MRSDAEKTKRSENKSFLTSTVENEVKVEEMTCKQMKVYNKC